jgi:hypothetical protein
LPGSKSDNQNRATNCEVYAMGLDAVELIMGWEEAFQVEFADAEMEKILTPQIAIDMIVERLGAVRGVEAVCPTLRAYNQVRQALQMTLGVERSAIKPRTRLRQLLPKGERQTAWQGICDHIGTPTAPKLTWATGIFFGPSTVQDLADWCAFHHPRQFLEDGQPWTYGQVRSIVRAVIRYSSGDYAFSDDAKWNQLP